MDGYRGQLNAFALKALDQTVSLPNAKLGIGDAEILHSVGFKLEYPQNKPVATVPDYGTQAYELVAWDGQGNKVQATDFPTTSFYYGNPIMGG